MSAHTRDQQYCSLHHQWFNCCCWQCEEERGDVYADDPPERVDETPDEREQQRVETYREAQRDEQRASSGV